MTKKHKIDLKIINIEDEGIHLMVSVKVNGKEAIMVVDTGASRTVFDINEMTNIVSNIKKSDRKSTGLGTNTMLSMTAILKSLQIGELEMKNKNIVLLDMQHINKSYAQLNIPTIIGVLGGDLLKEYNAIIDYTNENLTLSV